jgi:FAD/FMN-containing dehydrogenase
MHGSSPNVGVVGYLLGGGLSFYARRHGLASDHVLAIELVTSDGVLRRVDRDHDPDLFWALRGGGGNFGVVTAIEVGLLPYAEVFSGTTFWPAAEAGAVLQAWSAWTETVPDTVTTSARILRLPPLPEIPEFLRAAPCWPSTASWSPSATTRRGCSRRGAPSATASPTPGPPARRSRSCGCTATPSPRCPGLSGHALLGALDEAGIDAFLGAVGEDAGSSLVVAELRQLGGALAAPRPGGGALAHLDAAFALFGVGVSMPPQAGARVAADLALLQEAMAPYDTGRVYLNYHERGGSARTSFSPEAYALLADVRAAYDPAELFVASHRIAPSRVG